MASNLLAKIESEKLEPGEAIVWFAESYDGRRVDVPFVAPFIFFGIAFILKEYWAQVASLAVATALIIFPNWSPRSRRLYFILTDRRLLVLNGYLSVLRESELANVEIERVEAATGIIREHDGPYVTKWFCIYDPDRLKALRDASAERRVSFSEARYLSRRLISE